MAITVTYDDYDTVCYSNQHNIIKLIEHSIGFSVQININTQNIQQVANSVNNMTATVNDLAMRVDLLERSDAVTARRLDAVYNFTPDFDMSVTGVIIDNLRKGLIP